MPRVVLHAFLAGVAGATLLSAQFAGPLHAEDVTVDELKSKILNAQIMQQAFAKGLQHCSELNGANFYFQPRDRVLNLTDYHRALDSLAMQHAFNPETHRPWSQQDADTRWAEVQREAVQNQANCALVASLPDMQKKLQDLQRQAASSPRNPAPPNK
jgi:hypothetical protein